MTDSKKIFSLEGKGLKLDTEADLEKHIAELRAHDDVEEVRVLGNTLGIGACKLLGEVLATKKTLKVSNDLYAILSIHLTPCASGRQFCRHLHRATAQ